MRSLLLYNAGISYGTLSKHYIICTAFVYRVLRKLPLRIIFTTSEESFPGSIEIIYCIEKDEDGYMSPRPSYMILNNQKKALEEFTKPTEVFSAFDRMFLDKTKSYFIKIEEQEPT